MAGRGRYCCSEVVPFATMVLSQSIEVGMNTLFKRATLKGMSYRVFIVYSYALAGLVLLPLALIFNRGKHLPPFRISIVGRIFLLGLLGFSAQMLGYKGIDYSSPTLASAIGNLTPAFTFALAVLFRMETLAIRSISSKAKIIGGVVSISGALVMVLYKGPTIIGTSSSSTSLHQPLGSSPSNWIVGGLLLTVDYVVLSIWYIIQTQTINKYPAELTVVSLYNFCVALIAAPVCFILEPNLSSWEFNTDAMIISILYAGLLGFSVATIILTWLLSWKGPVYVALFTPLSIVVAAIMGVIILGDAVYLGSVVGTVIISVGFYVSVWGKTKELVDAGNPALEPPFSETSPLLQ